MLWDIDRTLVDLSGLGQEIYAEVFRAFTGRPLEHLADMAGRTDHHIITQTLELHGLADHSERLDVFYEALAQAVHARRHLLAERGRALPGAHDILNALSRVPGVVQSVVTGNIKRIAIEKLTAFGLDEHIDFEVGAYGSEDGMRHTLVREAIRRAEHTHGPAQSVTVIGDTPHDVVAATTNDVIAIGVTTGTSTTADLLAAGAHLVLDTLAPTADVLEAVLNGRRTR